VPSAVRHFFSILSLRGNLLVLASGMAIPTLAYNIVTPYESPYFLLLGGVEVLLGIFWGAFSIFKLARRPSWKVLCRYDW